MLSQPEFTQAHQRTYEQIGHRVKDLISDPRVQRLQFITISRLPNENPADWRRLLSEMASTAGIQIDPLEDGAYRVAWREHCES
jgi:hypothetical protein